jgi:hypothetical protein
MTEPPLLPRSLSSRSAHALFAATLLAAFGFGTSAAIAAQAEYAGPSTTPASLPAKSIAVPGLVATDHDGPRWTELSASQRKVLAPLANDWNDGIDSRGKERWLDVASRFHKMPADEQQRANQRMVEWAHMTIAERTQARMNFQESRSVSKEEREARWKAYQALPEDKKRELAKRAAAAAAPSSAASTTAALAKRHPPSVTTVQPKTNVVGPVPAGHAPAGSAPVIAQVRPGATTNFLNHRASPPAHQRDGQPKIAAGPNSVDRTTLLPRRQPLPQPVISATAAASTTTASHP